MRKSGFKRIPNLISYIPPSRYDEIDSYIMLLEGVTRLTNQCVYLIDFYKGDLTYLSDNPIFLGGLTVAEAKRRGPSFYRSYITGETNEMTIEIITAWLDFIDQVPIDKRLQFTLSYDYLLEDRYMSVSLTPIFLSAEGKPWLVLCYAKHSTSVKEGNAVIRRNNSRFAWKYSLSTKQWKKVEKLLLDDIEQQVLRFSMQGKSEIEISKLIFRSRDGLKSIKRRIFKKLDARNITEAVSYAISRGLIQ